VERSKLFAWGVVGLTVGTIVLLTTSAEKSPTLLEFLFWAGLLAAAELLAVSLGRSAEVSMGFPIHLTIALVFRDTPAVAMAIPLLAAFDRDELRLAVPLHKALFNRSVAALAVGSAVVALRLEPLAESAFAVAPVVLAAVAHVLVNLLFVAFVIRLENDVSLKEVLNALLPRPVTGFVLSYVLLTGLGVATAIAYSRIPHGEWAVAAILIPLLFARVGILAARGQQELSERLQKQQQALLEVTQDVFRQREKERQRIAADIHDSSLQSLAAAAYASANAIESLREDDREGAAAAMSTARTAVTGAIDELRDSLSDLRRSALDEGGLATTIEAFTLQVRTLWGRDIEVDNRVTKEPPIPVALAAFQILQEGVTNALKHSPEGAILVQIAEEDEGLRVVVQDEGPGFEAARADDEAHLGLRLMNERAMQIGGRVDVDTAPGRGTRLEAILPGTSS